MIETIPATGSTNADLIQRLARGEAVAEGFWLVAERQEAGRGRLGRVWSDGLGNFMGSSVVHLRGGDPHAGSLALVAGLAVHECITRRLSPPQRALLKWPNDVMIGDAKLAGILLERQGDAVVVGIGVNLASAPQLPDRATAALADFGPAPSRDGFGQELAQLFAVDLERWRAEGLGALVARWQAAAHPPGTPIMVNSGAGGPLMGDFAGLDANGALLLRAADGTTRTIHAGDISLA